MASNFARAIILCSSSRAATLSRSTFLWGTGTSASMKRTRAQTRGQASRDGGRVREEEEERACPVCLETLGEERTVVYPFECGHAICRGCDNGLWSRHLDNCPLCRATRCDDAAAHLPTRPARAATTPEYVTFPVSEVEILPLVGQFVAPDTDLDPTAQQRIARHHGRHEETPTRLAAVVAALQDPEIAAALRALQEPTTVSQFRRRVLSARRH